MRTRLDAYLAGEFTIPANDAFGFKIEPADDHVTVSWTVPPEYCNSAGNLQGGMLGAFVDAALGSATSARIPEDHYPALAEMKISFFRPAKSGMTLHAIARVVKPGKRLLFVEAEVTNDDGELIAKASATEVPAKV